MESEGRAIHRVISESDEVIPMMMDEGGTTNDDHIPQFLASSGGFPGTVSTLPHQEGGVFATATTGVATAGAAVVEPEPLLTSHNLNVHTAATTTAAAAAQPYTTRMGVPLAIPRRDAHQELSSSSLSEEDCAAAAVGFVVLGEDEDEEEDEEEEDEDCDRKPPAINQSGMAVVVVPPSLVGTPPQHPMSLHHHHQQQQQPPNQDLPSQDPLSPESVSSESMERTGSQNSSRDWGWFEDVHQSTNDASGTFLPTPGGGTDATGGTATSSAAAAAVGPGAGRATTGTTATSSGSHANSHNNRNGSATSGRPKKRRGLVPQVSGGEMHDYDQSESRDASSAMAVTAPNYVLEESLSSQRLWKETAGQRPPQPADERAFYEKMWTQNFARSKVQYGMPVEVLTATSPISLSPFFDTNFSNSDIDYATASSGVPGSAPHAATAVAEAALQSRMLTHHHHPTQDHSHPPDGSSMMMMGPGTQIVEQRIHRVDGDLIVLMKGDNVFGTTVSKSFARPSNGPLMGVDTVNISVASFRVVEGKGGKYAQFLVIYREGSIRDTIGVWKRYSDFEELARKVTQAHEGCAAVMATMSPLSVTEEPETEHLPNAITSWRLLKKRQRWYRCLDPGYLSLKVFLLERFLHDILFESSSPKLLRDFVGTETM